MCLLKKKKYNKKIGQVFKPDIFLLVLIFFVGVFFRFYKLGTPFLSSDDLELAVTIMLEPGYLWMLQQYYGLIVSVIVKFFVGFTSLFGFTVTEVTWKLPVAFFGAIQPILTYFFLRYFRVSKTASLFGSAIIAVLPIHVMQSRYMWGYEVLGVFFVTIAIWSLVVFIKNPSRKNGLRTSFLNALYLVSHGYILPYVFCVFFIILFYIDGGSGTVTERLKKGLSIFINKLVWVFPIIFLAFYHGHILHSLRKETELGFYFLDHLVGFVSNIGIFLFVLLLTSFFGIIVFCKKRFYREPVLFLICGSAYLLPIFLLTPPGITIVRGYMLLGIYFILLGAIFFLDLLITKYKKIVLLVCALCFIITSWSTFESIFLLDKHNDPNFVKIERGTTQDVGTKTAGYLIRKYVNQDVPVLSVHKSVERGIFYYYFGRWGGSFTDFDHIMYVEMFNKLKDEAEVVISDKEMLGVIRKEERFIEKIKINSKGETVIWIFAKESINLPKTIVDAEEYNKKFDQEFAPKISLK
jgi:hypothetical protein